MHAEGGPSIDDPVAYITLRVEETLRGADPGPEWTFMVYNCDYANVAYAVGSEMIICAFYHTRLKTYYQTAPASRYVWTGSAWAGESTVSDAALRREIADVDMAKVVGDATLIVDGTIESVDTTGVIGPDSSSAELITLGLRVNAVKKGQLAERRIKVVVITRGLYFPEWRKDVPREYSIGQRWFAMLKQNQLGWYPFAGANGFFRVDGTDLIYADRVPYWHSLGEIEKYIASGR